MVQPHFLQKVSPQELTVNWHGVKIPVQCKAKRPGAGRLISKDVVTTLACYIARDARAARRRLLVRIGTTGPIRHEDVEFLRHQVRSGVGSSMGPTLVTNGRRLFTVKTELLSGQFTRETIQDYLSSFAFHVGMIIGEPAPDRNGCDAVAVVGIEADPWEKQPWHSLRDSIKEGARHHLGPPHYILRAISGISTTFSMSSSIGVFLV